jgi:hypothetical protein
MPFNPAKKQFRRLAADRHDCVSGVNHQVIIRFITVNYEFNTPISSSLFRNPLDGQSIRE